MAAGRQPVSIPRFIQETYTAGGSNSETLHLLGTELSDIFQFQIFR